MSVKLFSIKKCYRKSPCLIFCNKKVMQSSRSPCIILTQGW